MAVYRVPQGGDADSRLFGRAEKRANAGEKSQVVQIGANVSACLRTLTAQGFPLVPRLGLRRCTALWTRWRHLEGSRLSGLRRRRWASERFLNWRLLELVPRQGQKVAADPKSRRARAAWLWEAPEDRCPNAERRSGDLHGQDIRDIFVGSHSP